VLLLLTPPLVSYIKVERVAIVGLIRELGFYFVRHKTAVVRQAFSLEVNFTLNVHFVAGFVDRGVPGSALEVVFKYFACILSYRASIFILWSNLFPKITGFTYFSTFLDVNV
jgi:hypothetical protein